MFLKSGKSKAIIVLIALASANGATFSLVDPSSLFSSLPSLGREVSGNLLNSNDYRYTGQSIVLETPKAEDVRVGGLSSEIISPSLDSSKLLVNANIEALAPLETLSKTATIGNISREITKETAVSEIDRKLKQLYEKEFKKLREREVHLSSLSSKVELFRALTSPEKPKKRSRNKRSLPTALSSMLFLHSAISMISLPNLGGLKNPIIFPIVTQEERKAIQQQFELFFRLSTEREDLLNQLKHSSWGNTNFYFFPQVDRQKMTTALSSLRRLGWTDPSLQLTPKDNLNLKPVQPRYSEKDLYGWNTGKRSWNTSPWLPFFSDQREWLKLMNGWRNSEKELDNYLVNARVCGLIAIIGGQPAINWCIREKGEYKSRIASDASAIELYISSWLLDQMQQESLVSES